ncbi:hypothetical protein GGS26DRAFT_589554 [Hypomontagnella submonticulosa]|nr:hypothetical protein GGS26DRAFT_589554 [Hypomontagnella submonticulosa]
MADDKSQDKAACGSGDEAKTSESVAGNTIHTDSGDEKTEDAAAADSGSATSQSRPAKQLPTHYKGMPNQWEKNRAPKKET